MAERRRQWKKKKNKAKTTRMTIIAIEYMVANEINEHEHMEHMQAKCHSEMPFHFSSELAD